MIWAVLTSIAVLFLLIVFLKARFKLDKVCAVCGAVSLTWLALLVLKFFGYGIDSLIIGILMGQSVTGWMYVFEKKAKELGKPNSLWLKIFIILLGTAFVYYLINFSLTMLIVSAVLLFFMLIFILTILGSKKQHRHYNEKIKKLEEKFEHCCD
ncbi:DUF1049 domain-containing protein [Candidatus Woesearchaeota archaeon]|nr:MAG: DUF1049 domain-containing protein [Candidatus Woesearchaeota archaeon]